MPKNALDFFVRPYASAGLQLRKKSRILAGCALSFGLISLGLAVLMAATKATVVAVVFIGILLFCALVLGLLRANRYHLASSLFLYGLFVAMFIAIKFDAYVNVYETYVFGTLGCFLLVVATLVADRPGQTVVITVLDLLAIQALYWLDSYPLDGKVTFLAIQNLAVSCLLTGTAGVTASYVVSMTSGLLRDVENRAELAAASYERLNRAMNSAQASSLVVGERLSAGVERSVESIAALRGKVQGFATGMDELARALGRSREANREAVARQDDVQHALTSYTREVANASSAIEQMATAAANIGSQTAQKREAVTGLAKLADAGEGLLQSMNKSIAEVLEASNRMAEMNVFIGDVVDRTNLLGMNASIEAAHAGLVGKGFAVVANQIRALSLEAGSSSRVISETLKGSQAAVKSAAEKNGEALAFFKRISDETRGVGLLLEELLANVEELSSGSTDILNAVETVARLTGETDKAVRESRDSIATSTEGLEAVARISGLVHGESAEMGERFDVIRQDQSEVERLGRENLATIQALKASIESP